MKKKLLSPLELKKFRAEQVEARRLRAEQSEKKNKKLSAPKELLDPKPVVEVVEEPVVEVVKEPIELLQERVEKFSTQYNEELAQLEVRLANKLELDDVNLQSIQNNIKRLRESISELPEVKYYDEDLEKLTERVDQLQVSGSEIFQQHGESLREIKKVTHQMLKDLDTLSKLDIPEAFDPTDIQTDIAATKETFYERVAELKKELSELPEVKYYDDELTQLQERIESVRDSIPEVPEIKYYDEDLENLLTLIAEVRGSIPEMPEVRYYEDEIAQLEESIKSVEDRIPTVPEVRYYEDDIEALREEIKNVEGQIPEVPEIPEFPEIPEIKYYDEEVEILSDDIDKVRDSIIDIKLAIRAVEKSVTEVEGREIPEEFDPTGLQIEIEKAFKEIEKLKEQPVTIKEDVDPLTPLEDKFVTFDELSKHYRTFITRIQQQLASLGGGGEVRLEFLDDVDRDSAKVNGKFLKYDSASGKWVGANASGGGGGSQTLDDTLGLGNTSSLGMSVGIVTSTKLHIDPVGSGVTFNEDLVVVGDARVTGILSIGTSSIVLDPNAKTISGVEELQVGETTIKNDSEGNITFVNTFNPTQTINVGIGTTASVNTTGIITASSFTGSLIGTATNATNLNNQAASYYLNYNNFSNTPTALSSFSNDVGFVTSSVVAGYATEGFVSNLVSISTFSGNYNDLTNTPTALSSFSNDVGFVTSSVVAGYATEGFVNSAVAGIVSSAPATLDTLNELAQALDDDANFSTTVTNLIGTKASLSGATFTGIVTATSFVKASNSGGFLKADGTEDTNTYLTSFTETNDLSSAVTWTNVPNANITESSVTQHQAALSITESQISDLQSYLTSYTETQTLNDVVGLGSATTQTITVGTATTGVVVRPDGTLNVSGVSTFQSHVHLGDNDRLKFGDAAGDNGDLQIYHNGTNAQSIIEESGGGSLLIQGTNLFLRSSAGENYFQGTANGSVELFYDAAKKFETTDAGVDVTGHTETDTLRVSGVSTFQSHVHLGDDDELRFGANNDFKIVHDPNDCRFENSNGDIKFKNTGNYFFFDEDGGETLASFINDGPVNLFHGGNKKFATTGTGVDVTGHTETDTLNVSGVSTFQSNVNLGDNDKINLGDGNDLQIYHDGSNSFIEDTGTGDLYIRGSNIVHLQTIGGEDGVKIISDSAVELYYDNSKKFATTGAGVTITGIATAATFYTESGTYNSGSDTKTDAAIVIEEEGVIYTKDGTHLRTLIEKKSDTINIGQHNTALIDGIELKPGNNGQVKIHSGGAGDNVKLETSNDGVIVTGSLAASNIELEDNGRLLIGTDDDLQIHHNNSNSIIEHDGTGNLYVQTTGSGEDIYLQAVDNVLIRPQGGENGIKVIGNAGVELYYDNSKKFETTASGIDVTGHTETDTLNVSGLSTFTSTVEIKPDSDVKALIVDSTSATTTNNPNLTLRGSGPQVIDFRDSANGNGLKIAYRTGPNELLVENSEDTTRHLKIDRDDGRVELNYGGSKKFETTGIGVSISNGTSDTATITGPSNLIIDPAVVGDDTGIVRIKGDLFVDGTTTQINSTSLEIADFIVGIASTATTDLLADGAGIQIGTDNTFLYEHNGGTNSSLKSSENLNVASGKHYQIGETERLSADTLSLGTGTTIHSPASNTLTFGTNGTEKLRITSAGNVGIGTDIPSRKLVVQDSGNTFLSIKAGTSNDVGVIFGDTDSDARGLIRYANNGDSLRFWTNGTEKVRITSDGNIGIGIDSPDKALVVRGANGEIVIDDTNGSPVLRFRNNGSTGGTIDLSSTNDLFFRTGGTTERLRISSAGLVGIGTDNPSTLLHLQSNNPILKLTDSNQSADNKSWNITAGQPQLLRIQAINDANSGGGQLFDFYRTGTQIEKFLGRNGGSYWFAVDNNNRKVGIGTDNPGERLDVRGKIRIEDDSSSPGLLIRDSDANGDIEIYQFNSGDLQILNNATSRNIIFQTHNGTSVGERLRITSGGDVGIGTDNISAKLHLHTNSANSHLLTLEADMGTNNNRSITITSPSTDSSTEPFIINTGNAYDFQTDGTTKLNIRSDGNVGIGTDNPATKLEVSGTGSPTIRVKDLDGTNQFGQILSNNGTFVIESRNDTSDGQIIFRGRDNTGTNEYARFDENGNLGIGTDNPSSPLEVSGAAPQVNIKNPASAAFDSNSWLNFSSIEGNTGALIFTRPAGGDNADGYFSIRTGGNAVNKERLRITSDGKVGINETAPETGLDIRSDDGIFVRTATNAPTNGARIQFSDQTSATQRGHIIYKHPDNSVSPGSNDGFLIGGTENLTVVKVEGRAIIDEKVGIGTDNPTYKLQVVGDFAATTKSFSIPHPTKQGMTLRYGSLESPYHGIRLTGSSVVENGKCIVELPDYIHKLVREEGVNIHLTNIRHGKVLWVEGIDISHNNFMVMTESTDGSYEFYWDFTAIRTDIDEMVVESYDC